MSAATPSAAGDRSWRTTAEKGSVLGIRFVLFLTTAFGRGPARLFVRILAFYYALFAGEARRGAEAFLTRIHGEPPSFGRVYRQILRFAQVTLDSLFLMSGKIHHFRVKRTGSHHLAELRESRRGAILLGAHLGSMYAMRAQSGAEDLPLYAVVFTKHAERINAVLEEIDPKGHAQLLQMGEGVDFMLRIKELIEGGAIVALLGDRVGSDERAVTVDFLGDEARLPTGPYILASTMKCPVYLTFGLYRDPDLYELYCEPFAERVELPRRRRQEALREYAQRYADRLACYARKAPDNWFNFYDFWRKADEGND
jgi:predicted LPLAT superfamily acyltransferase